MRVSLIASSVTYHLAGEEGVAEREHSSAAAFVMEPAAAAQGMSAIRRTNAYEKDRGNLLHRITFTTTRRFESHGAASLWLLDYDRAFPREGTLRIEAPQPDGTVSVRTLANARVAPPRREQIGCTVILSYSVTAGAISTGASYTPDSTVTYDADSVTYDGEAVTYDS